MKVLVTGSGGVVGTAVLNLLRQLGIETIGVSSSDGDLRDKLFVEELMGTVSPTVVVHLAGRVRGLGGNLGNQGQMFYDNLLINTNVIDASLRHNVQKIVAMGSVAVYSDRLELPFQESDIWNGAPHNSEYGYAQAKRSMIAMLEAYHEQYGLPYVALLATNMFGPNDRFDLATGHVIPSLIMKFHQAKSGGTPLTVWGSGRPTRDFLYSRDAAGGIVHVIHHGQGVYNLASGNPISIAELVAVMSDVFAFNGDIFFDTSQPDGQRLRSYNVDRLAELGWSPQTSFRDAIQETADWYAKNLTLGRVRGV